MDQGADSSGDDDDIPGLESVSSSEVSVWGSAHVSRVAIATLTSGKRRKWCACNCISVCSPVVHF